MVKKSTNTTDGIPVPVMAHPGTLEEWIASHTKYSGRSTLLPAELRELRKDYQKALTKYNHFAATAAVFIASFESQGKVANANEELAATNKDMHEKSLNALNQVLLSDPSRTENESNESIAGKAGRKQRSRTPTAASRLPKKAPTKKSAKKKEHPLGLSPHDVSRVSSIIALKTFEFGKVPERLCVKPNRASGVDDDAPVVEYDSQFDYSHLPGAIKKILDDNPNCNVCLLKDIETSAVPQTESVVMFSVIIALIVPKAMRPPEGIQLKARDGETPPIKWFSDLSLSWAPIDQLVSLPSGNPDRELLGKLSQRFQNRIMTVVNKTRSVRDETGREDLHVMFCRAKFLDLRPDKFPAKDENGRVEIQSAKCEFEHGGAIFPFVHTSGEFEMTLEELQDDIGCTLQPQDVKVAIRHGYEKARTTIENYHQEVINKYGADSLGKVRVAKIYPQNVREVAQTGALQELAAQHYRYQEVLDENAAKDQRARLESALETYEFSGNSTALAYGPVQNPQYIFDGRDRANESPDAVHDVA